MQTVKRAIVITGPTGVGKTDLSIMIAKQLGGEILNADVGQFYTPLTIGTAKPDWRAQEIAHHLFDVIDKPEHLNVAIFRQLVTNAMQSIAGRGSVPIVAGGSGFYVHSLLYAPNTQTMVPKRVYMQSTEQLWQELAAIDPERAAGISKADRCRLVRALDIWHGCGVLPSSCAPLFQPVAQQTLLIVLDRPLAELYARINERVLAMMDAGWLNEVRSLDETWHDFLLKKKLIGYDALIQFMRTADADYDLLIEYIQQKTRNYAKRQRTYARMLTRICQQNEHVTIWWLCVPQAEEEFACAIAKIKEWYESQ